MLDTEKWFAIDKTLTLTVDVKNTDKVVNLLSELNAPKKPICTSLGFEITSWSMHDVHANLLRENYISKLIIDNVLETNDLFGLGVLRNNLSSSTGYVRYPDKVSLQLVDLNVLESRLRALESKLVTHDDITNLLKEVELNKYG